MSHPYDVNCDCVSYVREHMRRNGASRDFRRDQTREIRRLERDLWRDALNAACDMLNHSEIEPRSALKQCASDAGVPYGEEMGKFVKWAEHELYAVRS